MTELSVLFVTYNSWRLCADAVDSLLASPPRRADGSPLPFEVVVDGEVDAAGSSVRDRVEALGGSFEVRSGPRTVFAGSVPLPR